MFDFDSQREPIVPFNLPTLKLKDEMLCPNYYILLPHQDFWGLSNDPSVLFDANAATRGPISYPEG